MYLVCDRPRLDKCLLAPFPIGLVSGFTLAPSMHRVTCMSADLAGFEQPTRGALNIEILSSLCDRLPGLTRLELYLDIPVSKRAALAADRRRSRRHCIDEK